MAAVVKGLAQDGASNIEFVENKGQWDSRVKFKGEIGIGAIFLENNGFSALLYNVDDLDRITDNHHGVKRGGLTKVGNYLPPAKGGGGGGLDPADALRSHAYRVTFVGGNERVTITPDKPLPGYNNYFIGRDPSKWRSDCKVFQGVTYKDVYPNIDIRYYTYNGQLKYDIIVHPGGDLSQVRMKYDGANKLSIKKGQLIMATSVGDVTQPAPYSYIFDPMKGKADVNCKYAITGGNTVSFQAQAPDPGATLIIDPSIVFCTFTGSKVSNWGFTATPGPGGSFFAGGIVFGSAFPYTTGELQPVYGNGQFDVGILKLNSSGSNKVYATYLGGQDSETPHSLFSDAQGNLVVMGRTYSTDFPFKTTAGSGGAADMFVAKINTAGSVMIGCMRIGGAANDCVNMADQVRTRNERADSLIRNYGDDSRSEVIIDGSGNILVAASSQSTQNAEGQGGFPIVGNVFQPNFGGGRQDGVVVKIDPNCDHLIWSSFLGGVGSDAGFVLKVSPLTGDIYVAGATASSNFPGNHSGVIQGSYQGGICDAYVAQISADGSTLKRSTFLGTDVADAIYGIDFDKKGFPYVMGTTNGTWPVVNADYSVPGSKQFISKLQPDLSAYVYSTVFGTGGQAHGQPNISPVAFLVDRCENVYASGWGGWIIGGESDPYGLVGTIGMPVTPDAAKRLSDNRDFYFIVIQKNASALLYGTFYGQNDNSRSISEHVDGGTSRYDQNGAIYQAICANCNGGQTGRFPTTPGVWSPNNGAGVNGCNLAAIKITFGFAGVAAGMRASVNGRVNDTAGCIPMDTRLEDTIRVAKSYIWNFGDGSPDTATKSFAVEHTYVNPGTYTVMMVAIDSNSCNVADTVYRHVIARTDKANLDFDIIKDPSALCTDLAYIITNQSTAPKPFTPTSFTWDFGDNSGRFVGNGPWSHRYQNPGTYNVTLAMYDTSFCNYPDSLVKSLRVSPLAKAQFVTPPSGCVPYNAVFNNTSLGGLTFTWNFGDGSEPSNEVNPTHLYPNPGTYTVTLHEVDPNTCNGFSDTSFTITVNVNPTADFTFTPSPPTPNTPTVFTNSSIGAVSFAWSFGDGDSAFKSTQDTVIHQYNETDTFTVCMVATNQFGCPDTVCHPVAALINPLLDVPNAFTPGRFGQNSIVKVTGFGILKMLFRVYNRYGKLVFQSDNPDVGWDGYFQGTIQPMGVYAYTLEADFSDGRHVSKKGDITLIR